LAVTKVKATIKTKEEWWDKDRWCNLTDKTCRANSSRDLNQWTNKEAITNNNVWMVQVCKDKEDIITEFNRIKCVEDYSKLLVKTYSNKALIMYKTQSNLKHSKLLLEHGNLLILITMEL